MNSYQKLAEEWHPSKNGAFTLDMFTHGSGRKTWWLGECGHEWEAPIGKRYLGANCPYCLGKRVLIGFNDLATIKPELVKEWHTELNIKPIESYTANSNAKVWWKCEKGHEWQTNIVNRPRTGCPVCSNRLIVPGINDIKTTHPTIAIQFDAEKNLNTDLNTLNIGSYKKIWWKCEKGHSWLAATETRKNHGCPNCGTILNVERKIEKLILTDNFAQNYPKLAKDFSVKNLPLIADKINSGSKKIVWWLGDCKHEWQASIRDRVNGTGCPYCAGRKVQKGFNDLSTTMPHLIEEWHPTLNKVSPNEVSYGSRLNIWWQCSIKKHVWSSPLYARKAGNGCPHCALTSFVSKPEKDIANFLRSFIEIETSNRKLLGNNNELDIYIPSKNIAIEFNGLYWHSEKFKHKKYHYDKWLECKNKGIQLIQIWEDEWNRNPEQIKSMLLHKLGFSSSGKVFARKTEIVELSKIEAENFLNANHVQGYASGSYYLGLKEKGTSENNLVAVLVLKYEQQRSVLNIIRYATNISVVGGFTKLLNFAANTYQPESFITFSDNSVSDGGLYENNGFVIDKKLPPDYMYVFKGKRYHKFGYRLKRFKNDPELKYVKNLTERELAELNGLVRIWDSGKTRWKLIVKK
jgi:hypothetical protein